MGSEHTEHLVFVPLTVFTEYVIENVDPIPVPPKSFLPSLGFQPSPYCMEPDMRNVPVPFLDNPLDFPLRVSTGDLNKLHISSHGTLTVSVRAQEYRKKSTLVHFDVNGYKKNFVCRILCLCLCLFFFR